MLSLLHIHTHTHTPTEVAWIITFTVWLLGNSKPTCQCVCVCLSVCEWESISPWNQAKPMGGNIISKPILGQRAHTDKHRQKQGPDPEAKITFRARKSGCSRKCITLTSCPLSELWAAVTGNRKLWQIGLSVTVTATVTVCCKKQPQLLRASHVD